MGEEPPPSECYAQPLSLTSYRLKCSAVRPKGSLRECSAVKTNSRSTGKWESFVRSSAGSEIKTCAAMMRGRTWRKHTKGMKLITMLESKEQIQNLSRLAREINDLFTSAEFKGGKAKSEAIEAVKDAIICGEKLAEVRDMLPHGQWEKWLKVNCRKITTQTARNWIRLSQKQNVLDLDKCAGLRQAYIECGILPKDDPKPEKDPAVPATVEDLIRFAGFAARITPESFSGMVLEQGQREKLRERLKPAHEAYLALGDAA